MSKAYTISRHIDTFLVTDDENNVIFYSNDGYINEYWKPSELKQELVHLYGVMDAEDTLEWADENTPDNSCNQCQALMINGVYCHETGCPNRNKVKIEGEWINPNEDTEYEGDN